MDAVTSRVFVANYAAHDYEDAERYGEIKYITKGFVSFQGLDRLKFQIGQGIMDATADDWLVLSGTNIINVLAALLWFQKHGCCKILNYDKSSRTYREIVVTKENNAKLLEVLSGEA